MTRCQLPAFVKVGCLYAEYIFLLNSLPFYTLTNRKMPESTFEWASKRPVSLLWGFASFAISFLSAAEFSPRLKPSKLRLSWRGVKERKEYYRLFTCLVTVEKLELPSLGLAVLAFALGTLLEARVFMRQPLSFLSSYLAAGGFIISSGFVYKELISRNYSEAFELMVCL